MSAYWAAPDGNGDDTIWTGTIDHPIAVVRRCDLAWPVAFDALMEGLALRQVLREAATWASDRHDRGEE